MGEIGTTRILVHTWAIVRANAGMFVLTAVLLTTISVGLDVGDQDGSRSVIIDSLASLVAQYLVTRHLIDAHWPEGRRAGLLPVFGVLLVSTLAILFGMILLIVPGIILAVRWLPVVPILIFRNQGVAEALRESWEATQGSGTSIFAAIVALYAPMIAALVVVIVIDEGAWDGLSLSITMNLLTSLGLISVWFAAVAYWDLTGPQTEALEEVFA
jgi:hypothetical protein